jgi:hypothetical protein
MMRKSWTDWPILPERAYELSSAIDKWKDRGYGGLSGALGHLSEQGIHLDLDDIVFLAQTYRGYNFELSVPPWLVAFASRLLGARHITSVLDPFGGNGLAGATFARDLALSQVDVLCSQPSNCIVPDPLRGRNVRYLFGPVSEHVKDLAPVYEAIASFPPIGQQRRRTSVVAPDGSSVELHDDPSMLELARVSPLLSQQGMVVWLVAPRFATENGQGSVRKKLHLLGLHASAMFHIPRGSFTFMDMAAELVVLERHEWALVFVGEIPKDADAQDSLIRRFSRREQGATPSQGRLVNLDEYRGLESLESREALDRYGQTPGLHPVPFSEAVISVDEAASEHTEEPVSSEPSAFVFLPKASMTPALMGQATVVDPKRKSYVQLTVNRQVILPEYLVTFLDSREGHVFRRSLMSGSTTPRIDRSALQSSVLYLPPVTTQQDLAEGMNQIALLRADLNELESRLLSNPNDSPEIVRRLDAFDPGEGFGYWVESLPFPVATILRAYDVADDDKDKYELLLQFFEALAQLLATMLLSAWRSVPQLWESTRVKLGSNLRANHLSMAHSTFGLWSSIYGLLSKEVREKLSGKAADCESCLRVFHMGEPKTLGILCMSEITGILQTANGWRNAWRGHGGAVTPEEAADRLRLVDEKLLTLRNQLGTVFDSYQLVLPGRPTVMRGGIHKYLAKCVMGSNTLLGNVELLLNEAAESTSLCFYQPGQPSALRLVGFLELRETPQPACFFFSSTERNGGLRFVSYQVTPQSERTETVDQEELLGIMRELEASEP